MSAEFAEPGIHSCIFDPRDLLRIPEGHGLELIKVKAGQSVKMIDEQPRTLPDGRLAFSLEVTDESGNAFPNCTISIGDARS